MMNMMYDSTMIQWGSNGYPMNPMVIQSIQRSSMINTSPQRLYAALLRELIFPTTMSD